MYSNSYTRVNCFPTRSLYFSHLLHKQNYLSTVDSKATTDPYPNPRERRAAFTIS